MRISKTLFSSVLFILAAGCGRGAPDASGTAELTRGQKDTIISQLPVPGAKGVGRALQAVERSQARVLEHDTIS